jgi:hypothetical protein
MSEVIPSHQNMFAVQRFLAASLFGLIFSAYLFAYLLYLFPSVLTFWWLSVPINQLMQPITAPIDGIGVTDPRLLMLNLLVCVVAPLTPIVRRTWLATAVFGHVALAIGVIVVAGNVQLALTSTRSASLLPAGGLDELGAGTWGIAITTVVLLALCTLNHVAFFRAARRR